MFPHLKGFVSCISDASIDFTPHDFNAPLSAAQRAYLKERTGHDIPQVFWRKQVHEDGVIVVDGIASCALSPDADAYVTDRPQVPIAIRTADCVPVFIVDPVKRVIGLAHAGWKGTHKGIVRKTIQTMQDAYGCRWHDIWVYLGPSIRSCCYSVGDEFKAYFPQDITVHDDGQLTVDIINANRRQLLQTGLNPQQIIDSQECTCCDHNYFSYRRDKDKAGRMISLMMLI